MVGGIVGLHPIDGGFIVEEMHLLHVRKLDLRMVPQMIEQGGGAALLHSGYEEIYSLRHDRPVLGPPPAEPDGAQAPWPGG